MFDGGGGGGVVSTIFIYSCFLYRNSDIKIKTNQKYMYNESFHTIIHSLNGFCPQLRIYKGSNKISIQMLQTKINNSNETFKDHNS